MLLEVGNLKLLESLITFSKPLRLETDRQQIETAQFHEQFAGPEGDYAFR